MAVYVSLGAVHSLAFDIVELTPAGSVCGRLGCRRGHQFLRR